MRLRPLILLTILAVACIATAEDGAVVPLSELKKSSILKKTPAGNQTGQSPTTAPATPADTPAAKSSITPVPAIPELPAANSTGDMPAVPDVSDMPAVPSAATPASPAASPNSAAGDSDEGELPAPMGLATSAYTPRDLLGRKTIPVTMPRDRRIIHQKLQLNALPENSSVIGKIGQIYKGTDGWFWVKYESKPGQTPLAPQRLLPCRILQSVEEIIASKPDTQFGIYGQAMIYDGMTYLMLRRVTVEDENKTRIEDVALKDSQTGEIYKPEPEEKSAKTPTGKTESASAAEAIAQTDTLLAGLMENTEGKTIRTSDAPQRTAAENKTSVAPAGEEPMKQGSENMVIDRLARVVKSKHSDWYEVHFVSDNTLREPPYLVLPNSKLADALRLNSYLGYHERKLRVSGEVIYYKGRRYILLTKAFPERDMRQF